MNTWIKRSLGTAAVAGGLLLGGAAMASADDGSIASQNATASSVSSPITIGGIDLGTTSSHSSSSSVTESRTDRGRLLAVDDAAVEQRLEAVDEDLHGCHHRRPGGHPVVDDPLRLVARRRGPGSSSSSQAGTVTGKAPISIDGLGISGSNEQSSADKESTTRTDRDGTTRTSERESADASKTDYALGVGRLTADPMGTLTSSRSDAATRDDQDASSTSTSEAAGSFSSPLSFEGITGSFSDERASMDARRDTVTDEDGTRSEAVRTADASRTTGGFDTGSFTADPMGAFSTTRSDAFSTEDRDASANRSASTSMVDLASPYRASGGSAFVQRYTASAAKRESMVADEDGTLTRTERTEDADSFGQTFGFGGSEGDLLGSFDSSSLLQGMTERR